MLSLYEILKASKTGIATDMWTALAGMNWGGKDSGAEVKELTGIPPLSIRSNGTMLLDYLVSGNMSQSGTPTPTTPIQPQETGERTGNLFDEKYPSISPTIQYMPMFVGDGTFTLSSTTPQTPNGAACLFLIAGNVSSGAGPQNKVYNEQSITVDSSNGYITIAYRIVSDYDPRNYTTMLNTGSTALPYENFGYKIPISSGGENLWDGNYENGLLNNDGTLNSPNLNYSTTTYILTEKENYTLSVVCNYNIGPRLLRICFYDENKNFISCIDSPQFQGVSFFYEFNFTAPANSKYLRFSYIFRNGVADTNIMLNTGTTTPVYLGEVESTRRIKKLVLTGEENITTEFVQINRAQIEIETGQSGISTPLMSTHYGYEYGFSDNTAYVGNQRPDLLYINDIAHATSVANFKSFLAQQYANGTPVTVWYVLATPTTAIVNEPLRKIGDYADTLSMEQAGVQIPTLHGNTVIDVLTELKPSEMYIKYQK